ncbi:type III-B CRISPR module RAMP protein Cmr4 [Paraneptunicella aestuarii]|uniref:type III-B CRISPR module RAMP protein Cmr4 n=1 Tax=Paraneptunicella aestuarii TaxID=2831148 RepID=UPI001E58EC01|nr:type III-B CRISPR module RAMP protein Cmr4 [Paraneptunicella aestuarii]UAA40367.1 type III-B CRISPR module RAMP protein Cmr4 [Paraneptunicella aestuarii]
MTSAENTNAINSWMVLLTAETSIHAGAGDGNGLIDLPIMREAQNHWPCVYGSAMKGAIKAKAEGAGKQNEQLWNATFGKNENGDSNAGRLLVGDARILALPVRCLNMPTVKVTCVSVLKRFVRDAKRLGLLNTEFELSNELNALSVAEQNTALADSDLLSHLDNDVLYLEEHRFQVSTWGESLGEFSELLPAVNEMVIVRDEIFGHLCTHAVPITPHIRINSKTGTVVDGALWYEESLPAESILYWPLSLSPVGRSELSNKDIADYVNNTVLGQDESSSTHPASAPYVQIGGNETVGMGWCKMELLFKDAGGKSVCN